MERIAVQVQVRHEKGKGPSRRLRKKGLIPAILYGPHRQPLAVAIAPKDLRRILASGENTLVDLRVVDGEEVQTRIAMVKSYDLDPLTDKPRHVDLYEVSLEEAVRVEVPLEFVGEPIGVTMGGSLTPLLRAVEVSCLPEKVPHEIKVDCSKLRIGDILHVRDIVLPEGVKLLTDPTTAIVTVTGRMTAEVMEAAKAEEQGA